MNFFCISQMFPILSKNELSCFNYLNLIEAVRIHWVVSNCSQSLMKQLYITHIWMSLFEVARIWIKLFPLAKLLLILWKLPKYFQFMEIYLISIILF